MMVLDILGKEITLFSMCGAKRGYSMLGLNSPKAA
jgi:hypothetical protein